MEHLKALLLKLAAVVSLLCVVTSTHAFTYDELYPDQLSMFVQATRDGTTLSAFHKNPITGYGSGFNIPTKWQYMGIGQSIRLRILLPPGANYSDFRLSNDNMVAYVGVCEDGVQNCTTQLGHQNPIVWPLNYAPGVTTLTTLTTPKVVELVMEAKDAAFTNLAMQFNINIADYKAYEAWRLARNWAGGTGDCDGLSNSYCNGTVTTGGGTTTPTFSITPATQNVMVGSPFTVAAASGFTIASCVSSSPTLVPSPAAASGGATASSTVAASATAGTSVTITCTSGGATPATATATIAITAPAFGITPATQQVAPGAGYTLTAQNGSLMSCSSTNSTVIPHPQVATGGATAAGSAVASAASGSQATITCLSTAGGMATAAITVATPVAQSLALSGLGLTKLNSTSAEFSATLSGAATGYWVAFPYTTTVPVKPSGADIIAGKDAGVLKGSDKLEKDVAKTFTVTGLSAGTSYQVFFYAEDTVGNKISVTPLSFVTNVVAAVGASIVATPGGTNGKPSLSVVITPASTATGEKLNYVAALVPGSVMPPFGAVFFLTKKNGWIPWVSGSLPSYQDAFTTSSISVLDGALSVEALVGTEIYAGYAVGDDFTVKRVYTVIK